MVSMFAGVNSPKGFVSRFSEIQNEQEDCRKIYIKGGPGMGKSTILKRIAARAEKEGYYTEVFPCSSDKNSFDGVNIPELKIALVDATAPHCSDPIYLGVGGTIFNTAECIDNGKIKGKEKEIRFWSGEKKELFAKGYNYLTAAAALLENTEKSWEVYADKKGIKSEIKGMAEKYFYASARQELGKKRSLFLSAVCPDGVVSFADKVFAGCSVVSVKGKCGVSQFMKGIGDFALWQGFDVTVFYCPLFPEDKYEHILIPELKLAFTTYNYYHHKPGRETVDLDRYIPENTAVDDKFDSEQAEIMVAKAAESFAGAKRAHAFLESIYTPAMDFGRLDEMTDELEDSIFM